MTYAKLIQECRKRMGAPPRWFMPWNLAYLTAPTPQWLTQYPDDGLWPAFREQTRLRRQANLMWGWLLQANSLLFKPGEDDCPAYFVISSDPAADNSPQKLKDVATLIFKLKGTQPADPVLAEFARNVTDEMSRDWVSVPERVAVLSGTFVLTLMVVRKHLPLGFLPAVDKPYPILAMPGATTGAWIVPERYWPKDLIAAHLALRDQTPAIRSRVAGP